MPVFVTCLSTIALWGYVAARSAASTVAERAERAVSARARTDQRGQATAEYALVLLGCAAVALLVGAWATKTGKVGQLLDKVMDSVLGKAK
ncbi:MAG TPA: hypothetical protein VM264_07505 [Acidimicrobiales bacterium]|nr:hypothetical protein [Acidimicrobiales bacterium]